MKLDRVTIIGFIKATIFGFTYLAVSDVLEKISVFDLLAYRFTAAALTFLLFQLFGVIKIRLKGKNVGNLIVIALFQPIGYYIFEAIGISKTSSLLSGIIVSFSPIIVIVLESIILKEKSSIKQKLFVLLSAAGVLLIAAMTGKQDTSSSFIGVLFIFLAVLSEGFFMTFTRKNTEEFTSIEITYVLMMVSAIAFNGINLVIHISQGTAAQYFVPLLDGTVLLEVLYLGVLASSVAYVLYAFMLSKIQASSTAIYAGVCTVVSILAGIIFRNESFLWYHAVGTIMILAGVWGVSAFQQEKISEGHKQQKDVLIEKTK